MKKLLTLLFGLTLISATAFAYDCTDTATSGIPEVQCDALVRFYNELDGPNWTNNTNWLINGTDIETWYGVDFDINGSLHISLPNNLLSGELTSRDGLDSMIFYINLVDNNVYKIPESRGTFTEDNQIYLKNNNINEIPKSRRGLENTTQMSIEDNNITEIPNTREYLNKMAELSLGGNKIKQQFPINHIEDINNIYIQNNYIYGDIPNSFLGLGKGNIQNNYFNTGNVTEPLLSHLNSYFSDTKEGKFYRHEQNKAFVMHFPSLGYYNDITKIPTGTYTNINFDCTTDTKTNATTIAGGYTHGLIDPICNGFDKSINVNMIKFK